MGAETSPTVLGYGPNFTDQTHALLSEKHSPMEKKILHFGGVHTIATRRFLASKFSEERKMLRELQLQSSDYKKATKDKKFPTYPCSLCEPPEKLWTAKVVVPAEEFKMPPREKIEINKHVERMQLARTLRKQPLEPYMEKFRSAEPLSESGLGLMGKDRAEEEEDSQSRENSVNANQEDGEEAEHTTRNMQEITMSIIFKSEEPKKCLLCHRNHIKPFLPEKKPGRTITGLTNRNVHPIAEFPGDLMLMKQHFISQGLHPSDAIRTYWLPEKNTYPMQAYPSAPSLY